MDSLIMLIAGGVFLVIIIWIIWTVRISLSPTLMGRALLLKKLREYGLDPHSFPRECLHELVENDIKVAQVVSSLASFKNFKTELLSKIELSALDIARMTEWDPTNTILDEIELKEEFEDMKNTDAYKILLKYGLIPENFKIS